MCSRLSPIDWIWKDEWSCLLGDGVYAHCEYHHNKDVLGIMKKMDPMRSCFNSTKTLTKWSTWIKEDMDAAVSPSAATTTRTIIVIVITRSFFFLWIQSVVQQNDACAGPPSLPRFIVFDDTRKAIGRPSVHWSSDQQRPLRKKRKKM